MKPQTPISDPIKKNMKNYSFAMVTSLVLFVTVSSAQTLFVPGGTVGSSPNGNVGIGTNAPDATLTTAGDLHAYRPGGSSLYIQMPSTDTRIFTAGAIPMYLGANGNLNQLTLAANGYVGIGTPLPDTALRLIRDSGASNGANDLADFTHTSAGPGNAGIGLGYWANGSTRTAGFVRSTGNLPLYLSSSAAVPQLVVDVSGNVGVGSTSPFFKFEVKNDNYNAIRATGSSANSVGIYIQNTTASGRQWAMLSSGGGPSPVGSYSIWDDTAQAPRFVIDTTGNVGIGTTSPTQKLSVKGTIRAQEVIVDTGWSDYVFDDDYELDTLSKTEAFVRSQKHLPGIPSAKEVSENGISVGEMQAKLLAKIEELTLHVIAQEKELKSQRAIVTAQAGEIADLRHAVRAQ